jgi:hypothetical protein
MNDYYAAPSIVAPAATPMRKPLGLKLFTAASAISFLGGLGSAVIVFAGGRTLAGDNVSEVIKNDPQSVGLPAGTDPTGLQTTLGSLWNQVVDSRYDTLSARASGAVFVAVVVLVVALLARKGALWARVLGFLFAFGTLILHALIVSDQSPTSVTAFSLLALAGALVCLVAAWLPGINQYAKDLKVQRI